MKVYRLITDALEDLITSDRSQLLERIIQLTKDEEKFLRVNVWDI